MKKEILRISNLNMKGKNAMALENISLCILEGEIIGFMGLAYSGKDLLVQLLCGAVQEEVCRSLIYIEGKRMMGLRELKEMVYRITPDNYIIKDWSVTEYIGLVGKGYFRLAKKKWRMEEKIQGFFKEVGLEIDISRKMGELTELEKRFVDLVKARWQGKRLLVIEDEFEGMSREDIEAFTEVMKRLAGHTMGVVVNSYSDIVQSLLPEKYVIFKKGRIVKKCRKDYIKDRSHLEMFLLGESANGKGADGEQAWLKRQREKRGEEFTFGQGEVVTFLTLSARERERLFLKLSGRSSGSFDDYVRKKVVSVWHLGSEDEVFPTMSAGENLLLPSLGKLSTIEYIRNSTRIPRVLQKSIGMEAQTGREPAKELGVNELISITLERWYIYNPSVLVLFEPFAQCDMVGVSIVKSYIKKFTDKGTTVIIVKSREEYIEDISDRIIRMD